VPVPTSQVDTESGGQGSKTSTAGTRREASESNTGNQVYTSISLGHQKKKKTAVASQLSRCSRRTYPQHHAHSSLFRRCAAFVRQRSTPSRMELRLMARPWL